VNVSEDEVMDFLIGEADEIGRAYEVNVREILSDSLHQALAIFEKINAGDDMGSLARTYSKRKEWAACGGQSGFFRVSTRPDIGFHALDADTGVLVGPLKTAEGYSLFRVLGKRMIPGGGAISYDSLKVLARQSVLSAKATKVLNEYVASSARRHNVKISYNRLKSVSISKTNMVTRRFIGFGGSMTAVPGLPPLWEWVDKTRDYIKVFP
jgi:hypothetical protein